jgi:hypothetical protein
VDISSNESHSPDSGEWKNQAASGVRARLLQALRWCWSGEVSDGQLFAMAYVVVLPFLLAPLFATRLLPGLDLPFHLAAADLLSKVGRPDSPYAPYYTGGLHIAPYAAHFIALVSLGKVMNLLAAHKLIVMIYVAGMPLAMASLLATCRRSRIPALLAFPLAYNLTLHYGFISFALSLPVVLWLLAQMTKLANAETRRAFVLRWFATAGVAILLFLCHLQNFLYGVCAALAFAALSVAPLRRRLVAALALVPAFAGLTYWQLSSPPVAGQAKLTAALAWSFLKRHRLNDLGATKWPEDLWNRTVTIPLHALRGFMDGSHAPACRGLVLIMTTYVLVGLLAWPATDEREDSRSLRRRRMRLAGVIAFLGAWAAYLALPHHLQELELMTFFPRFSVLVLLMFLLLVPSGLLRLRGAFAVALPIPAIVFGALYGGLLYRHYKAYGAEIAGFVEVAEKTPPGGKALGLVFDRRSAVMQVESTLIGIPSFYPALRPAKGSMVPPNYCGLRHMPCRLKVPHEIGTSPWSPSAFLPAAMLPTFDYFFVRSLPPNFDLFRGYHGMVELVARSGPWAAFRKKPGPIVPDPPRPVAPTALAPAAPPAATPAPSLQPPTTVPVLQGKKR